jgi:GR25 family glycosyltransferase involved in LPS biosynthesis
MNVCLKIEIKDSKYQNIKNNILFILNNTKFHILTFFFIHEQNQEISDLLEERNIKYLSNSCEPDFIILINDDFQIKKMPSINLNYNHSLYIKSKYKDFTFYHPIIISSVEKNKVYYPQEIQFKSYHLSDEIYLEFNKIDNDFINFFYYSINLYEEKLISNLEHLKNVYPSSLEFPYYLSKLYLKNKNYIKAFNTLKEFISLDTLSLIENNPPKDRPYQEDLYFTSFLELFSLVCFHLQKYSTSFQIIQNLLSLELDNNKNIKLRSNLNFIIKRIKDDIQSFNKVNPNLKNLCFFVGYTVLIENGSLVKEIYGSELALFSLINELKGKYNIFISGQNIPQNYLIDDIKFLTIDSLRNFKNIFNSEIDMLVISRYLNYFMDVEHSSKKTFLWLHDICIHSAYNGQNLAFNGKFFFKNIKDKIDNVIVLSKWHKTLIQNFYEIPDDKISIIGNAIEPEKFNIGNRQLNKFIWLSDYNRGLEPLIKFFPEVHKKYPDAELHIFRDLSKNSKLLEEANKHSFIKIRNFQPNQVIIQELLSSDFWLYPTNFTETYCISALEAQAAGCIVIASDLAALTNTIEDRGFLIKDTLYSESYWSNILNIIDNLNSNHTLKESYRKKGIEWAKKQNWKNRSERWLELFEDKKNNYVKVKIVSNWCSCKEMIEGWKKLCKDSVNGIYENIQITEEDKADYYVVINYNNSDYYEPEKTILMRMEPKSIQNYNPELWIDERKDNKKYFHIFKEHNPIEWHLSLNYQQLTNLSLTKSKLISTVVSSEYNLEGHKKRIDFLKYFQEKNEIEIDVFGKSNKFNFKNYKGMLPLFKKDEGLLPYKYTIACENSSEYGYFTEKIADAILSECLCFYWGSKEISKFINPEAIIFLNLDNFEEAFNQIREAIKINEWEKRINIIKEEKKKFLDNYNILSIVNRLISKNNFEIKVVNLKRREDRWSKFVKEHDSTLNSKYSRFNAIDGKDVVLTEQEKNIFNIPHDFKGKRFPTLTHNYQSGVIGCALSHIKLWKELLINDKIEYFIVLEDDISIVTNFQDKWNDVYSYLPNNWDLVYLGFNDDKYYPKDIYFNQYLKKMVGTTNRFNGGGTYGYCISKDGAKKLLEFVNKNGIKVPIDHFMIDNFDNLDVYITQPHLVFSKVYGKDGNNDSDIQNNTQIIKF